MESKPGVKKKMWLCKETVSNILCQNTQHVFGANDQFHNFKIL